MENINELIGQEAFEQITRLDKQLGGLINQFEKSANASKLLNNALSGTSGANSRKKAIDETATSLENLSNVEKEIIKTESKLADANDVLATKLAQLKLAVNEQNKSNRDYAKTNKQAEGSINQLSFKLTAMRKEYDALSASLRNSPIGKDLLQNIQKTDTALKQLDATTGRHQRNVGNYQNQLFGLTQVFRELPAFTYSAQTGILGLSNNLPILADNFKSVANATNLATGKINGTAGALKIFASSIFSFGNIFAIAIGLFTIFSKEIFNFIGGTKEASDAQKKLNAEIKEAGKQYADTIATAKVNLQIITDLNSSYSERSKAYDSLNSAYPELLSNMTKEEALNGGIADSYEGIIIAIEKTMKKKAQYNLLEAAISERTRIEEEIRRLTNPESGSFVYYSDAVMIKLNDQLKIAEDRINAINKSIQTQNEIDAGAYGRGLFKPKTKSAISGGGTSKGSGSSNSATKDKTVKDFVFEFQDLDRQITLMNEATDAEMLERVKKGAEERLKIHQDAAKRELEESKRYAELVSNYISAENAMFEEQDRKEKEIWDKKVERLENYAKLVQGFTEILTTISNAQYESEMAQIEQRSKFIEENYDSQLKKIERSNLSQQKKEEATQKLETQTEALRKKNDRDRIAAARKKAQSDKAADIANIISGTAVAVVNALGAKPFTPLNLATAAIVGGIGLANLARAIATPLPQYADGTDDSGKAGPAIVGERGTELGITKDGKMFLTPSEPTLMHLPAHTKIINHEELKKNAHNQAMQSIINSGASLTSKNYELALIASYEENTSELKKLRKDFKDKQFSAKMYSYNGFNDYINKHT